MNHPFNAMKNKKYELPGKLEGMIGTLSTHYGQQGKLQLQRILVESPFRVEDYSWDNWDGGIAGHAIYFRVPQLLFLEVMDNKGVIEKSLDKDFNTLNSIENEHIDRVILEVDSDPMPANWHETSRVLRRPTPPNVLRTEGDLHELWIPGLVRLFLSHKDHYKAEVSEFKDAVKRVGLTCFVAHQDIEPTKEWQNEIEKALFSMDAFVAFLTEDFHDSKWTDQEVGVAVGRKVPIIPIRVGSDPCGLIGKYQGLSGYGKDASELLGEVYDLLWKKPELELCLTESLVTAFENSEDYKQAIMLTKKLDRIRTASDSQIDRLEAARTNNSQVQNAYNIEHRLQRVLDRLRDAP